MSQGTLLTKMEKNALEMGHRYGHNKENGKWMNEFYTMLYYVVF